MTFPTAVDRVYVFFNYTASHPQVARELADFSGREMWAYARGRGYDFTREEFVDTLKKACSAGTLPEWLKEKMSKVMVNPNWLDP